MSRGAFVPTSVSGTNLDAAYVRRDTATVDGTLDVTGVATFTADATVGGDLAVTGAATIGGTLGTTGTLTVGGNANITGGIINLTDTSLYRLGTGLLRTDDSLSVGGTLAVTGAVTSGAVTATGANQLYASGATTSATTNTNWLRSPQGTVAVYVGSNSDASGLTVDQADGVIRFSGPGAIFGDIVHCPTGGTTGTMGQIRFCANSSTIDTTPDLIVGVGALYVHRNDALRGIRFGTDVNLYRNAADTLRTDDALSVGGSLSVAGSVGFYGGAATAKQTVTGSRGGNAALASLLTALSAIGLITDSSTA